MTDMFANCAKLTSITSPSQCPNLKENWQVIEVNRNENTFTVKRHYIKNVDGLPTVVTSNEVTLQDCEQITFENKTDELLFDNVSQDNIRDMLLSKAPIVNAEGVISPFTNQFIIWAKDTNAVKTNFLAQTSDISALQTNISALQTNLAEVIETLTTLSDYVHNTVDTQISQINSNISTAFQFNSIIPLIKNGSTQQNKLTFSVSSETLTITTS